MCPSYCHDDGSRARHRRPHEAVLRRAEEAITTAVAARQDLTGRRPWTDRQDATAHRHTAATGRQEDTEGVVEAEVDGVATAAETADTTAQCRAHGLAPRDAAARGPTRRGLRAGRRHPDGAAVTATGGETHQSGVAVVEDGEALAILATAGVVAGLLCQTGIAVSIGPPPSGQSLQEKETEHDNIPQQGAEQRPRSQCRSMAVQGSYNKHAERQTLRSRCRQATAPLPCS